MPTLTTSFTDVDFVSEQRSLQRYLASLATFTGMEIRRHYERGVTGGTYGRPYMIVALMQPKVEAMNTYWGMSRPEFYISYYPATFDLALAGAEEFERLSWVNNRIPLYDYKTDPGNPALVTDHMLRVEEVDVELVPDPDEDNQFNVTATVVLQGSRSVGKYSGEQIANVSVTS